MKSSTHAARMDGVYRHQKHIYDLTRKYFLLGRDGMIREMGAPHGARILELGCGTGRNIAFAARHYPQAEFFGLDISSEMLETARKRGIDARLALADATSFDGGELFGHDRFDRIFISYALSMIPGWEATIDQALAHLSPGGSLHVVDFGDQNAMPAWFKAGLNAWLRKFHVSPRENMMNAISEKADAHGARVTGNSLYRGFAQHAAVQMA
ncbi:class I SAM-dependent methyltransferase [Hoeflea prorocentri]|uniref:Class I SAM-dependent methyltransferase n=1 Tax=Hoeflea prorocentri TaxID=1922333 RepID=A0A9X3ZG69_9HYPH|nr:class I SAM-dependent methyltransferase [Hoeflea prorocentri]MCY6379889.1 class I SAM-dependent methyltransferase [Hoeflea prorocentri]MDA5397689.1 class I SAM-dependent methyltransferase [Hoeflea prorocentri]